MNPFLLVGVGFLLGTAGVKAAKSEPAHDLYVKSAVAGMRAKESCETIIDEAKAEFDDIMAEAGYEKNTEEGEIEEVKPAPAAAKKPAAKRTAAKKAPARARRGAAKKA